MTDMKVVIVPKKGEAEKAKPLALKPYVPKKFGGVGFKNEKKHSKKALKKQLKEDFFARSKLIKSIVKNATRESVIKVDTDSKGVVTKADAVPRMIASERSMARSVVGMKPYRTVLCQQFNVVTGSTNTTYAPVFPADVTLANNWQDWVDLFDEVRIIKTELIASQFVAAAGTAVVNYAAVWGVSCDLEDASAETSIQNQIVAPYHAGPFSQCNVGISGVLSGSGAAAASTFGSFQPGGLLHLHSPKLPMNTLPVNSGGSTAANPVNGNWAPVTSASIVGNWFKYYVEPSGVGISFNIRPFIAYEVEFRLRG